MCRHGNHVGGQYPVAGVGGGGGIGIGTYLLTYLKIYLTTLAIHNIFVKIQWVDFQMGRVILTNYLNSHLNIRYSGHTAFKLVKRGCIFRLRRKTIPQHCTTILKTSFKIVCFRFWKC